LGALVSEDWILLTQDVFRAQWAIRELLVSGLEGRSSSDNKNSIVRDGSGSTRSASDRTTLSPPDLGPLLRLSYARAAKVNRVEVIH
jgi:hypothetical protein